MATFGGACDALWSCRNGRNVVINEARWLAGSSAWTAAGGTLRDYRHMVVNHETGHWLGLGHVNRAAPGCSASARRSSTEAASSRFSMLSTPLIITGSDPKVTSRLHPPPETNQAEGFASPASGLPAEERATPLHRDGVLPY